MPTLIIEERGRGQRSKTIGDSAVLGCGLDCEVVLQGETDRLAQIEMIEGKWRVRSLSDSISLFVNGRPVKQSALNDGDELNMGKSRVTFHLAQDKLPEGLWDSFSTGFSLNDAEARSLLGAVSSPEERRRINPDHEGYLKIAYEISSLRAQSRSLRELAVGLLEVVFRLTPAELCCIMLSQNPTSVDQLICTDRQGRDCEMPIKNEVIEHVVGQGTSFSCRNVHDRTGQCAQLEFEDRDICSLMAVPLRGPNGILGAIKILTQGRDLFGRSDDLQLMTIIGNEAGLAIHNQLTMQVRIENQRLAAIGRALNSLTDYLRDVFQGIDGASFGIESGIESKDIPAIRTAWERLQANHQRLRALVQTMLHATEQRPLRRHRQSIKPPIDQVCEMLSSKALTKGCIIESTISENLPWVLVDEDAIRSALFALIDNAVDAVPDANGRVRIDARATRDRHMFVEITDNGPGMDLDQLPQVFEAFYTTKAEEGTGIGLFNARKIIREHNGQISVRSQPQMGTTFTIDLPVPKHKEKE
ncbi:MAG: ATP-binding protein [Candidatus Alcyoniella australis]|nr:ATP-binding protein [Candidatus Alcyoniella australis]